jgi:hypothetical protein
MIPLRTKSVSVVLCGMRARAVIRLSSFANSLRQMSKRVEPLKRTPWRVTQIWPKRSSFVHEGKTNCHALAYPLSSSSRNGEINTGSTQECYMVGYMSANKLNYCSNERPGSLPRSCWMFRETITETLCESIDGLRGLPCS